MRNKYHILVIDDDEAVLSILSNALIEDGFIVDTTRSAVDGFKLIEENSYDAVLTDIQLPDMNGKRLLSQINEAAPCTAIIIITSHPSFDSAREALHFGAFDYITTPFNLREVLFILRRAVSFSRLASENKRLLEKLKEQNEKLKEKVTLRKQEITKLYDRLKETYIIAVKALISAIDAKDHYTFSHSENVTRYALAIAKKMSFSNKELELLRNACELHDIGKIGIHDYILTKPGKLTIKERQEIETHSDKAAQILKPLKFLDKAIDLIYQHHERFDGKGYPSGVKGKSIILGARIMAVADAYDAMVSERPYRKRPFTKEEANAELKRCSGKQFDPEVVKVFLEILEKDNDSI